MRRIGVDVGGTNTDAVLVEDDRVLESLKTPTTDDVTTGVAESLRRLVERLGGEVPGLDAVMIGTTRPGSAPTRAAVAVRSAGRDDDTVVFWGRREPTGRLCLVLRKCL